MASVVNDVVNSVITSLQSIAEIDQKVFTILSEEDLMDGAQHIRPPCAGVLYEGMRSKGDAGRTHKTGLMADLSISILVFYDSKTLIGENAASQMKVTALNLLDTIRNLLRDTQAPGGHFWRFMAELPAMEKNGVIVYMQRWSTTVALTQGM